MSPACYRWIEDTVSERDYGDTVMLVTASTSGRSVDRFFRLNEAATLIWKTIRDGGDVDEAVHAITQTYEIDDATAREDVEAIVAQLLDFGAIEPLKAS